MANMDNRRGLREVRVSKPKLLERLKENRSKHREEYQVAITLWEEEYRLQLETLGVLATGTTPIVEVEAGFDKLISLDKPFQKLEEYDDTIELLEASVDDFFVLPERDFQNYWLDKWSWKDHFSVTNSSYAK